ncbi:hypothetical protein [[Mycoplasma] gypis]|uniref:Uncharacterized protein n=1 Tax=[Mycoplasma] gypis TaxID=92404 RepID=A0ABZ2RTD2_9BACT|nr:hypothetical protein [[Mycoplasma] gypis]MBN0919502.1 hypothetical protein [[Mycoplasma] gypis]
MIKEDNILDATSVIQIKNLNTLYSISQVLLQLFPVVVSLCVAITFSKNYVLSSLSVLISWLIFILVQSLFIYKAENGFNFLFYKGINSAYISTFLNSSYLYNVSPNIIVGLIIGFLTSTVINKMSDKKIFTWFNFNRSIMFFLPVIFVVISIFYLMIVGGIAKGMTSLKNSNFINNLSSSYIVGFLEKLLLPLGMNSSILNDFNSIHFDINQNIILKQGTETFYVYKLGELTNFGNPLIYADVFQNSSLKIENKETLYDLFLKHFSSKEMFINPELSNSIIFNIHQLSPMKTMIAKSEVFFTFKDLKNNSIMGIYSLGNLMNSLFFVPLIGVFIIYFADKSEKMFAFQVVIMSIIGSFLLGTQYTLITIVLFSSPLIYFVIFVLLSPVFQILMVKIGITLETQNGGIVELIRLGISSNKRIFESGIGFLLLVSIISACLFSVIYFLGLKKMAIYTPGRGNCISSFIREEYQKENNYVIFHKDKQDDFVTREYIIDDFLVNPLENSKSKNEININTSNNKETQLFEVNPQKSTTELIEVMDSQTNKIQMKSFESQCEEIEYLGVYSPVNGFLETINISSSRLMMDPKDNNVYSPVSGILKFISYQKNEFIFKHKNIKIHLEIQSPDTEIDWSKLIKQSFIKEGQEVEQGQVLVSLNKKQKENLSGVYAKISLLDFDETKTKNTKNISKTNLSNEDVLFLLERVN